MHILFIILLIIAGLIALVLLLALIGKKNIVFHAASVLIAQLPQYMIISVFLKTRMSIMYGL